MKFLVRIIYQNLKRFLLGAMFGGALFAALVGTIGYQLVRGQAFWVLATVSTLVALGTMLAAVIAGVRYAGTEALRGWVHRAGAGPMLAKVIFKQALDVSDKKPRGSTEVEAALEGVTLGEAKKLLAEKLGGLFHSGALDRWLPSQGRWIAKKLTSTAGWAVAQAALDHFDNPGPDDQPLDLLALRDSLATGLNERAIGLVSDRANFVAAAAIIAVGVVCVAVAAALSML